MLKFTVLGSLRALMSASLFVIRYYQW